MNIGLLDPLEVCRRVEAAWKDGAVPLNSAEGFIRQILGWREYMRGINFLEGPDYPRRNALNQRRMLPALFWGAETRMNCLSQTVAQTRDEGYAHHIQRLVITGNVALLSGVDPAEVREWYLSVYWDAIEWVEAPNTVGMSQFADGGIVGSKPYVSSGAYIDRMSDYRGNCAYSVKSKTGEGAFPSTCSTGISSSASGSVSRAIPGWRSCTAHGRGWPRRNDGPSVDEAVPRVSSRRMSPPGETAPSAALFSDGSGSSAASGVRVCARVAVFQRPVHPGAAHDVARSEADRAFALALAVDEHALVDVAVRIGGDAPPVDLAVLPFTGIGEAFGHGDRALSFALAVDELALVDRAVAVGRLALAIRLPSFHSPS